MAAHLRAAEVLYDRKAATFYVTIPACLSSAIGRGGWLVCRLDSVCRADQSAARSYADPFEAEFHRPRSLVLPRALVRRHRLSVGARVDITVEARAGGMRWAFWRRAERSPIHPHGSLTIDMGDDELSDPRLVAMASEQNRLGTLRHRLATEMAAIQAAIDAAPEDQELRRVGAVMARESAVVPTPSANVAVLEPSRATGWRGQQDLPDPDLPTPAAVAQEHQRAVGRPAYSLRHHAG